MVVEVSRDEVLAWWWWSLISACLNEDDWELERENVEFVKTVRWNDEIPEKGEELFDSNEIELLGTLNINMNIAWLLNQLFP